MEGNRRRHWLVAEVVEPELRLRIVVRILTVGLLFAALSTLALVVFRWSVVNEAGISAPLLTPRMVMWGGLIVCAHTAISLMLGNYFAHRVAGPIHLLKQELDRLAAGDFDGRVQLQPSDDFGELAASLNRTIDTVQRTRIDVSDHLDSLKSLDRLQARHITVRDRLEDVESLVAAGADAIAVRRGLEQLRESVEGIWLPERTPSTNVPSPELH